MSAVDTDRAGAFGSGMPRSARRLPAAGRGRCRFRPNRGGPGRRRSDRLPGPPVQCPIPGTTNRRANAAASPSSGWSSPSYQRMVSLTENTHLRQCSQSERPVSFAPIPLIRRGRCCHIAGQVTTWSVLSETFMRMYRIGLRRIVLHNSASRFMKGAAQLHGTLAKIAGRVPPVDLSRSLGRSADLAVFSL